MCLPEAKGVLNINFYPLCFCKLFWFSERIKYLKFELFEDFQICFSYFSKFRYFMNSPVGAWSFVSSLPGWRQWVDVLTAWTGLSFKSQITVFRILETQHVRYMLDTHLSVRPHFPNNLMLWGERDTLFMKMLWLPWEKMMRYLK